MGPIRLAQERECAAAVAVTLARVVGGPPIAVRELVTANLGLNRRMQTYRLGFAMGVAMSQAGGIVQHKFKIGQTLFYNSGGRDRGNKAGPFEVLGILPQAHGGVRYRIRSQNDRLLEYIAREEELHAS